MVMAPALRVMTYDIRNGRGSHRRVDVVALQEVDIGRLRSGRASDHLPNVAELEATDLAA